MSPPSPPQELYVRCEQCYGKGFIVTEEDEFNCDECETRGYRRAYERESELSSLRGERDRLSSLLAVALLGYVEMKKLEDRMRFLINPQDGYSSIIAKTVEDWADTLAVIRKGYEVAQVAKVREAGSADADPLHAEGKDKQSNDLAERDTLKAEKGQP